MPTRLRSFAKINLGLAVGPVRSDGFHELLTLYHTIEAHDWVTVDARRAGTGEPSSLTLAASDPRVPLDERNTVWKMLDRALQLPPFAAGAWTVHATIEKQLPVQGGLGAGSANAAVALLALQRETALAIPPAEGLRIAAEVGSDVPLFLLGGAVLGRGRGEEVYPLGDLLPPHTASELLLALPELGVSTPAAFRALDASRLTGSEASHTIGVLSRALASCLCESQISSGVFSKHDGEDLARHPLAALVRTGIRNDFEPIVFRQHSLLGTIKCALLGLDSSETGDPAAVCSSAGALYAALSGSGSALFGLYAQAAQADAAEARLRELRVRALRTRLLGREAYWQQMVRSPGE